MKIYNMLSIGVCFFGFTIISCECNANKTSELAQMVRLIQEFKSLQKEYPGMVIELLRMQEKYPGGLEKIIKLIEKNPEIIDSFKKISLFRQNFKSGLDSISKNYLEQFNLENHDL